MFNERVYRPLPAAMAAVLRRQGIAPTRHVLVVSVADQRMWRFERAKRQVTESRFPHYRLRQNYLISSSAYGIGQTEHSNRTPLGLHRIARKIGGGHPIGTVLRGRRAVGLTWQGQPNASIVHRILWLEGLQPGFNRGGTVDTFRRYIYIHGFGDETTLGRPQSHGCIHLAAKDLIPLHDLLPAGTLVWIGARQDGSISGF